MLKKALQVMTFMVMVVIGLVSGNQAQASVVDATPFVDKISITNTEFYPRETGEIKIDFSGKQNHQFHPGDEMVFQIPNELIGFKQDMWMGDYAQVRVENGRVIVKFTEKVQGRKNIKASITFGVKGSEDLPRGSKKSVPVNLGTRIRNYPMINVSGYAKDTGRPQIASDFAYKGGQVNDSDVHVMNWYIVVNPNNVKMAGNVVVTDSLGFGHELVPGSLRLGSETVNGSNGSLLMDKHSFKLVLNQNYVNGRGVGIYYQTRLTKSGEKFKTLTNSFAADFQIAGQRMAHIDGSAKINNVMMSGSIDGEYEELHANIVEENNPDESKVVGKVEDIIYDNATEGTEANNVNGKATKTQPEVHVNVAEEVIADESEELGTVEEIVTDNASETVIPNRITETADKTERPEVHVNVAEEVIADESEALGTVEEIVTDNATESVIPNRITETTDKTERPEVRVNVAEEVIADESEELGTVEEIVTDNATESVIPNRITETADKTERPEVRVNVAEEVIADESEALGTVEEIVTDNATETVIPNRITETADKTERPEVHVNVAEEVIADESEKLGTVEEIVTDNATETVIPNRITETADKTERPEVHVNVAEEVIADESEELGTVEEIVTDNVSETIVPNNVTEKVEITKPEVQADAVSENEAAEEEVLGQIEDVVMDNAVEVTVPAEAIEVIETTRTPDRVEMFKPEVHVRPLQEVEIEEEVLEDMDEVKMDKAREVIQDEYPTNNIAEKLPKVLTEQDIEIPVQEDVKTPSEHKKQTNGTDKPSTGVKQVDAVESNGSAQNAVKGENELPNTGSHTNYILMFVGVMMMFGLISGRRFGMK